MNVDVTPPPDSGRRRTGWLLAGAGKITARIRHLLHRRGSGCRTQDPALAACDEQTPRESGDEFSSEMFVQLLLELPEHRQEIMESWHSGDMQRLRRCVHRLLGATVYCAAPELEDALRELRRALHTGNASAIARQHSHALEVIDTTLNCSGCR